jgi:tetratricopeptide (TPR) repeat protein
MEALRRELAINPNHFESHLLLGLLLRQDSRNDEARAHVEKALSLRPGDPGARYQLALVQIASGELEPRAGRSALVRENPLHRGARLARYGVLPFRPPRGRQPRAGGRAAAEG